MTTLSLWRVVLQQWPQGRATGMVLLDFSVFLGCFLMLLSVMEHLAWMWQILSPDVLSGWYTGSSSEIHASQRCLGLGPAQPQLLTQVTHSVAGTWEPRPPSLLVGLVEIKSFSERPVAAGSSHLPKPGLHPAVSASAQLGWTSWSSLPRWPNPLQALFGAGQSKGLLGRGRSPEELGCDESRVKPSPASVRACEIKTQKGRDQTRLFPRCSSSKLAPQGWEEAAQGTGRH